MIRATSFRQIEFLKPAGENMFREFLLLICLFPTFSFGQIAYPSLPQPLTRFSFEDKDWAVAATANPKKVTHGPRPRLFLALEL